MGKLDGLAERRLEMGFCRFTPLARWAEIPAIFSASPSDSVLDRFVRGSRFVASLVPVKGAISRADPR